MPATQVNFGWEHFQYQIHEVRDNGLVAIVPAAADGTPTEFVKQKAAHGMRIVRFVACTKGEWPEVPAARTLGPASGYQLLATEFWLNSPIPCGAGLFLYSILGEYRYQLINPRAIDAGIPVGGLPASVDGTGLTPDFPSAKFQLFLTTGKLAN